MNRELCYIVSGEEPEDEELPANRVIEILDVFRRNLRRILLIVSKISSEAVEGTTPKSIDKCLILKRELSKNKVNPSLQCPPKFLGLPPLRISPCSVSRASVLTNARNVENSNPVRLRILHLHN